MDEVECRLQIDGDDGVPLLLGHAEHQSVLGDTGVVHQNINASKLLLYGLYHLLGLREVGSIRGVALGLDAQSSDFLLRVEVDLEVGECDVTALRGILQCDSLSDTGAVFPSNNPIILLNFIIRYYVISTFFYFGIMLFRYFILFL